MQSLDEKTWNAVQVDSFADVMSGKDIYASERIDGKRPYVTAGTVNNGIGYFVGNDNNSADSHVISVNRNGAVGESFFHPYKALFGNDCRRLKVREAVSDDAQQFMAVAIKGQKDAFSYSRKLGTGRLQRLSVMLPVADSGEPDYAYMAEYVQQKRDAMLTKYRAYVKARIAEIGKVVKIPALDEKEWKPIFISDMFEFVRGCENNMAVLEDGDLPLISAKANNNGLKGFVHSPKKAIAGRCITLNNDGDGGAGLAYYQPANMALDTHVTALIPRFDMSMFVMLFIAECISGLHGFFGHGLSISNPRARRIRIMLPVNDSGEPDYEYMEQYAKNTMLRKYQQYLPFLQQSNDAD